MKLSIIIPVYNVEKYLSECLESILVQDNSDFEVILVDNNSTDKSPEIIDRVKKRYPKKVRSFLCSSWGASAVRNFGVLKARGEYIWFVDSDDWIEKDAISKLIRHAEETRADAINFSVRRVYPNRENILTFVNTDKPDFKKRYIMYGFPPFQNIYRRDFWNKHFSFPEGIIHEDMAILSSAVLYSDNFSYIDEVLYNYRQRSGSVLHKAGFDVHSLDIFKALGILYGKFKEAGKLEEYFSELEYFFIWNLLIDSAKDFNKGPEGKVGKEQTRATLKRLFPNWYRNQYLRKKPLKFRINCLRGFLGLLR
ncbi:glycosyltransferase [Candidatus Saccharibacteria bacterium]|nr:glycosyltransferase [Candidatus Saccharibacteria bacterium]